LMIAHEEVARGKVAWLMSFLLVFLLS